MSTPIEKLRISKTAQEELTADVQELLKSAGRRHEYRTKRTLSEWEDGWADGWLEGYKRALRELGFEELLKGDER